MSVSSYGLIVHNVYWMRIKSIIISPLSYLILNVILCYLIWWKHTWFMVHVDLVNVSMSMECVLKASWNLFKRPPRFQANPMLPLADETMAILSHFLIILLTTAMLSHTPPISFRNIVLTLMLNVWLVSRQLNTFTRYVVRFFSLYTWICWQFGCQYVYKGPDRATFTFHLDTASSEFDPDKIKSYVDACYVSALEAYAWTMGWPTHSVCIVLPSLFSVFVNVIIFSGIPCSTTVTGPSRKWTICHLRFKWPIFPYSSVVVTHYSAW